MKKITLSVICVAASLVLFSCSSKQMQIKDGAVVIYNGKTVEGSQSDNLTQTDRGLMMTFESDVLFPTNSSYLTEQAKQDLLQFVETVANYPNANIQVDGHTDATGTAEYNKWLSDKRANSVKEFLANSGISASRISTAGYGLEKPIATNKTKEGRQQNRRVEITILD